MTNLANVLPSRTVLRLDGILCLVMGAALISFARDLGALTDLPEPFLTWAGAALVPIGLFILAVALPREPSRVGILVIVAGNAAWVVASFASVAGGFVSPNALGLVLVFGQALAVALIAMVESAALRSSTAPS